MKNTDTHTTTSSSHAQQQADSQPFFQPEGEQGFFGGESVTEKPFFLPASVQPRLTVGAPNDKYEQEADQVADQVVQRLAQPEATSPGINNKTSKNIGVQRSTFPSSAVPAAQHIQRQEAPELERQAEETEEESIQLKPIFDSPGVGEETVQRKCSACKAEEGMVQRMESPTEEETPALQAKCASCEAEEEGIQPKRLPSLKGRARVGPPALQRSGDGSLATSGDFSSRLQRSKGSGSPLDNGTRSSMEGAMGADLSGVRVHTGSEAAGLSSDIGAQAFTHGSDVYFNEGKYDPGSSSGQHLLAHELTHTVQQGGDTPKTIQKKTVAIINYPRIADQVHDGMSGMGTDEEAVYQALSRLNHQKEAIKKLKDIYKSKFKSDLVSDIKEDFSGQELKTALGWLKPNEAAEKEETNSLDYDKMATNIKNAISGAGTDEEAVYAELGKLNKNNVAVQELKKVYKEKHKTTLESDLMSDFGGADLNLVLELINSRSANESVKVNSDKEQKEAQAIIERIWVNYGIDVNSQAGIDAIKEDYSMVPDSELDKLKVKAWEYKELVTLEKALAHFSKVLGENRKESTRSSADQEVTTVSKIDQAIDKKSDKGQLDTTTLGEYFRSSTNFSIFTANTNSTSNFPNNKKHLEGTAVHEIAHGLFKYSLSDYVDKLDYWTDATTKSGKKDAEAPITAYGKKSASEDLSEAAKYYFIEPNTLKKGKSGKKKGEAGNPCPIRYAFIEKTVKAWNKKKD